ncbi:5405_t:CDS:2, partial [Ambispora gerdemannii]
MEKRNSNGKSSLKLGPSKKKSTCNSLQSVKSSFNVKKQISDDSWNFSHEIRNTPKPRRPNLGKGLEEFHKKILTSFTACFVDQYDDGVGIKTIFKEPRKTRVLKFPPELTAST